MNTVAPFRANTPIEAVTIGFETSTPVRFYGNIFESCTKTNDITECLVNIQKRPLEITLNSPKLEPNELPKCLISYAGQNFNCFVGSGGYAGGVRFLNSIYTTSALGLTSQQLQTLKSDNWFAQFNQNTWSNILIFLSVIFGILAAIIIWQYPNRYVQVFASLVIGLNIFYQGIIQIYKIKPVTNILLNLNESHIMFIAALFALLGTGLILTLNWQRQNLIKFFSIIGGVNIAYVFGLLVYGFLVSGGFIIADY
ncbi:hypothetical protein [Dulcicalothrix desertica]|uniref:hypothetical protein n=1 Tax=Dulcicalothrix desertica TaxID=32056 RepID=UPI000F8EBE26|nr:hypothetical protein [Dulcicalothrix desertica]